MAVSFTKKKKKKKSADLVTISCDYIWLTGERNEKKKNVSNTCTVYTVTLCTAVLLPTSIRAFLALRFRRPETSSFIAKNPPAAAATGPMKPPPSPPPLEMTKVIGNGNGDGDGKGNGSCVTGNVNWQWQFHRCDLLHGQTSTSTSSPIPSVKSSNHVHIPRPSVKVNA